jgi:hypothetical protein
MMHEKMKKKVIFISIIKRNVILKINIIEPTCDRRHGCTKDIIK